MTGRVLVTLGMLLFGPAAFAQNQVDGSYEASPPSAVPAQTGDVRSVAEIGMSFAELVALLGQPEEVENSYFIGSDTDAIRYGSYWLISREGQILDCVVHRRGYHTRCGMGGCESRDCEWYLKNEPDSVVKR
jgi:hypothetical protein